MSRRPHRSPRTLHLPSPSTGILPLTGARDAFLGTGLSPVRHCFPPFFGRVQSKVEPKKDPLRRPRAAQTWPAMRSFGPSAAADVPCSTVPSRWFRHRRHRFGRKLIRDRAVASSRARCSPTHVISSSDVLAKSGGHDSPLAPESSKPQSSILFHWHPVADPICDAFLGSGLSPVMHDFPPFFGRVQSKVEPKKDPLRRPRAAQTWPAMRSVGPSAAAHVPCPTVPSRWFRHRRHRCGRRWMRDRGRSFQPGPMKPPIHASSTQHHPPHWSGTLGFFRMRRRATYPGIA